MLAFCTSPSEISLVLGSSDARWLSGEMSFLSELYRSKAGSSERQFGEEGNVALASFLETATKCQQLSVALQQAVGRGHHASGAGRDQPVNVSPAPDPPASCFGSSQSRSSIRLGQTCDPAKAGTAHSQRRRGKKTLGRAVAAGRQPQERRWTMQTRG
jgi:hypothetical protein